MAVVLLAVILVVLWRLYGPTTSSSGTAPVIDRPDLARQDALRRYKIDIYYDREHAPDIRMAREIEDYLGGQELVRKVVTVASDISFASNAGLPHGYEVRYSDAEDEREPAAVLAGLLTATIESHGGTFVTRAVGTRTPGTLSVFLFSRGRKEILGELWKGKWEYTSINAAGNGVTGIIVVSDVGENILQGTYREDTQTEDNAGRVRGRLSSNGLTLWGRWERGGLNGRFVLDLYPLKQAFTGTYSMGNTPPESNPANIWNGQRLDR